MGVYNTDAGVLVVWGLTGLNGIVNADGSVNYDADGNPLLDGNANKYFTWIQESLEYVPHYNKSVVTIVTDTGAAMKAAKQGPDSEYAKNTGRHSIAAFKQAFEEQVGRSFNPAIDRIVIGSHSAGATQRECIRLAAQADDEKILRPGVIIQEAAYEPFVPGMVPSYAEQDSGNEQQYLNSEDVTYVNYDALGKQGVASNLSQYQEAMRTWASCDVTLRRAGFRGYKSIEQEFAALNINDREHTIAGATHGFGFDTTSLLPVNRTVDNNYYRAGAVQDFAKQIHNALQAHQQQRKQIERRERITGELLGELLFQFGRKLIEDVKPSNQKNVVRARFKSRL